MEENTRTLADSLRLLGAYVETGLTPEQCMNAKTIVDVAFSQGTSKAEKIRALLKADEEKRIVMVPCRKGDTLWTYATSPAQYVYPVRVKSVVTADGKVTVCLDPYGIEDGKNIGKTIWRTKEEAEAALERK